MPRIRFPELLHLYHCTSFDVHDTGGEVYVADVGALETLRLLEADFEAAEESQYNLVGDITEISLGDRLRVNVGSPRLGLGILARHFDALLLTPSARVREPVNYFIVEGAVDRYKKSNPKLDSYHSILRLVEIFSQAGAYLDHAAQELVLIRGGKFVIPIKYTESDLNFELSGKIGSFLSIFTNSTHETQKFAILSETLARICEGQAIGERFRYVLKNIDQLTQEVVEGYKIYVSEFSYSKIRNEIESAKIEYINKIHKTFVDIQGQLLGIPVATIVVASQLKVASSCGVEFWTNLGVVFGAWVFLALLLLAAVNQWYTLNTIAIEVDRQKNKINSDYVGISSNFTEPFRIIKRRIRYHKIGIFSIFLIAMIGVAFGTFAFKRLTSVNIFDCVRQTASVLTPESSP